MRLLHFSAAKTFAWLAEVVIVGLHRRLLWLAGRLRWQKRVVPRTGRVTVNLWSTPEGASRLARSLRRNVLSKNPVCRNQRPSSASPTLITPSIETSDRLAADPLFQRQTICRHSQLLLNLIWVIDPT